MESRRDLTQNHTVSMVLPLVHVLGAHQHMACCLDRGIRLQQHDVGHGYGHFSCPPAVAHVAPVDDGHDL